MSAALWSINPADFSEEMIDANALAAAIRTLGCGSFSKPRSDVIAPRTMSSREPDSSALVPIDPRALAAFDRTCASSSPSATIKGGMAIWPFPWPAVSSRSIPPTRSEAFRDLMARIASLVSCVFDNTVWTIHHNTPQPTANASIGCRPIRERDGGVVWESAIDGREPTSGSSASWMVMGESSRWRYLTESTSPRASQVFFSMTS